MRSIVLTLGVLIALAGGFAAFMITQPKSTTTAKPKGFDASNLPDPPSTNTIGESPIGVGEGVWISSFDKDTGELVSEFRTAKYEPPVNGVVHVEKAEARFYTRDGQMMTVVADHGDVVMPEQAKRSDRVGSMQAGQPTRGTLNDVTLSLY